MAWRRSWRWLLSLGLCAAVGGASFLYVRDQPRCVISGPYGFIRLSEDGSRLLSQGEQDQDNGRFRAQVWDTRTGQPLAILPEGAEILRRAHEIGPDLADRRLLAVRPGEDAVHVIDWQANSQRVIRTWPGRRVVLSPGGNWLLGWAPEGERSGSVFEVATGKTVLRFDGGARFVDDRFVLFGWGGGANPTVWDLRERRSVCKLPGAFDIETIVHAPTSGCLVRALQPDDDHTNRILQAVNVPGGETRFERTHKGRFLRGSRLSPDGRHLVALWPNEEDHRRQIAAALRGDHKAADAFRRPTTLLEVLDLTSGRVVAERNLFSFDVDFSPDGGLFLLRDFDNAKVTIFETATGRALWERDGQINRVRFAADALVIGVEAGGHLEVREGRTGTLRGKSAFSGAFGEAHAQSRFHPESRFLLAMLVDAQESRFWQEWLARFWPDHFRGGTHVGVVDTATGSVLYRRRLPDTARDADLSLDGGTLAYSSAVGDDEDAFVIHVWGVQPHRAWLWAAINSLAAAAGLWLVGQVWRRCRRGKGESRTGRV